MEKTTALKRFPEERSKFKYQSGIKSIASGHGIYDAEDRELVSSEGGGKDLITGSSFGDGMVFSDVTRTDRLLGSVTKHGDVGVDALPFGDLYYTEVRALGTALDVPDTVTSNPRSGFGGVPTDAAELLRVGERTWTLTRLFNVREGFDAADETLPSVFERPFAGGPSSGDAIDTDWFDGLRRRYYAARGWNEAGIPTRDLLDRLNLLDVVDEDTPVARESTVPYSD